MLQDLPGVTVLLIAVALCPAFLTWRRGRALARAIDDPALPEQLQAARRQNVSIWATAFGVGVVISHDAIEWTLPLMILAHVIASFPLRTVLYKETWSLGGYLLFIGRMVVAIWGFWLTLLWLPFLAAWAGRFDWIVAIGVAALLLLWNARYDDVLRRVLRTRPVTDPVLVDRFTALAQRSSIPMPRFECIPLDGGAIPNALALPGLRRSSVLFTETLLAQLDADETTAICAHEIAHLEHHTPRLMRRLDLVNIATIAVAAGLAVLPRVGGWDSLLLRALIWAVVLFAAVAWRARDRQKNETASDLRAISLCGDPEALIRGLTKVYTFARMPRRLEADVERHATHPSLARRIRDIREAAGSKPAALGETSVFAAVNGAATVTFDADRLHWSEGNVATHSVSYAYLSELRLQVAANGATSLVAVERGGHKWQIAVAPTDVTRLQAVLDLVDSRLGNPGAPPAAFGNLGRFAAGFAASLGVSLGQFGMALVALIALLQPSAALLAGAGAATLCTAVVIGRAYAGAPADVHLAMVAMFTVFGMGLLGAAYTRRHDDVPSRAFVAIGMLAVGAVLSTAVVLMNGFNPVQLHLSSRAIPSAAVLLVGSSVALACLHLRPLRYAKALRYASAPLALAGLAALTAGSTWFLDRFGRDPFLEPADPVTWSEASGALQAEATVPFYASAVELSPTGRAILVSSVGDRTDRPTLAFRVGRPEGPWAAVEAEDLVFVDDDRLLGVYDVGVGSEIRETSVDAPDRIVWRQRVEETVNACLSYTSATQTWRFRGVTENGALVQVEGRLGSDTVKETRWPALDSGRIPQLTAVSGGTVLAVETEYLPSIFHRSRWWQLAVLLPSGTVQSRFSRITSEAHADVTLTRFVSQCHTASIEGDRLLCSAFDGTRTRFIAIDAETTRVTPMAWMEGQFTSARISSSGWLSGWTDAQAVAVRPATREALRVRQSGRHRITHLTATDRVFAAVSYGELGSTIRVYQFAEVRRAALTR